MNRYPNHTKKVLHGNAAAAEAAVVCNAEFIPAYPITPQTTIVEKIANKVADGKTGATFINMDSEHSVFCAAMGASVCGVRIFTATSGQGLFYAHEVLHAIAHSRLPVVACNVGRPSFPWNIWSDQTDSLAQRDTGWIQLYGESAQEVIDSVIQAYRVCEEVNIPGLVVLDAFYQSHTSENVWIPSADLVNQYLPPLKSSELTIDGWFSKAYGGLVPPAQYDKFNHHFWKEMSRVEDLINSTGKQFKTVFGREYGAVEAVNISEKTKQILVTLSSITSTAKGVLGGHKETGLIKIRLFRPFPKKSIFEAIKNIQDDCSFIVIDRNYPGEIEGTLMQEMKRVLYGRKHPVYNVYAGVGGRDVPPDTIEKIIEKFRKKEVARDEVSWIDLE
ncbi:MAG: pyruvate ferredoxin oxidoreductase [Bacteroidetes bacterium]|nr:pyruvate ferredoxin oxidoreductase [Bacteroidota bacterium]